MIELHAKANYFSNFKVNVIGLQSSYITVKTLVDVKNLISIQEFQAELRNKFVRVSGAKINERRSSTSRLEENQRFLRTARQLAETYWPCDVRLDSRSVIKPCCVNEKQLHVHIYLYTGAFSFAPRR